MSSLEPSSVIKPSTIATITIAGVSTAAILYALYFDHRRRSDPEFRKALKRDSKKSAKAAKAEAEASKKAQRAEIRRLVEQVNREDMPQDAESLEAFFLEEVSKGEQLANQGETMEAALCFFRALKAYPAPQELISIYDKTMSKQVLDVLAEMIALDDSAVLRKGQQSQGASFEDDV